MSDNEVVKSKEFAKLWNNPVEPYYKIPLKRVAQIFFQAGQRSGIDKCVEVAMIHEQRIKHTSHRDGLGMGSLCCEKECREVADAIRKLKESL